MKALSIKQPWAYLIVAGIKSVENRTWKTNFRGTIYIHACKKWDNLGVKGFSPREVLIQLELAGLITGEEFPIMANGMVDMSVFKTGGIIGKANIADVWPPDKSSKEKLGKFYNDGCYAWILNNQKEVGFIPCKGQLGLWNYVTEQEKQPILFKELS